MSTVNMGTVNTLSKNGLKKLDNAINYNKDAIAFYNKAKEDVVDPDLSHTFDRLAKIHESVLTRLDVLLHKAQPSSGKARETLVGASNRLFGKLLARFSKNPDEMLIKRLEDAEDRCLESLKELLEEKSMTDDTRTILRTEYEKIQATHTQMRAVKKQSMLSQ